MLVAKLTGIRSYGFRLSENLSYARFRVYKDRDGNGRMKTNKQLGEDLGLEKSCRAVLYLKGVAYIGILLCDGCVRMHIPRDVASMIFNGSENKYVDLWLMVRKMDGYIEIFEIGQRRIDDYIIELGFFNPVTGLKNPRYGEGYRYCGRCREAFLTISRNCPRCNSKLRSKPKRNSRQHNKDDLECLL